ncbi:MAG: class I SAM-dependent methyltransferase [Myxococcota bacterium]
MSWYDRFSLMYDASLEKTYRESRSAAVAALCLNPGDTVVDLACGTGQSFSPLRDAVGEEGRIVGVDLSPGMLSQSKKRIEREGWTNVTVHEGRAETAPVTQADALFCALGFTTFPDWEQVFQTLWEQLQPGTTVGIFDVIGEPWTPQKPIVEWMAQADLDRRVYEPLERMGTNYRYTTLPGSPWVFGGTLFVGVATR